MKNISKFGVLGAVCMAVTLSGGVFAQECEPSKWGSDDEIGAANLITPASVLAASKLIKTGKTYALGITVDSNTPAYPPRSLNLQIVQPNQQGGQTPFPNKLTYNDDVFQGWFGVGSQIDGLGHAGRDGVYYNCNKQEDFAFITGLRKLSVDKVPPIVARGVLLDMAGHFGMEHLEPGPRFNADDIKSAAENQGVEIREGDVVLFYTGWTEHVLARDPDMWGSMAPGPTEDAIRFLVDKNVVAVGSDTFAFDPIPPESEDRPIQGHIILLAENGIYILEVMNTGALVRDEAWEFLFVLGQARIKGTAQMMINPVAIR